jgi:hypothetical protein
MSYLKDFYNEALKNKKIKSNAELITTKAGSDESGNLDFYGEFASTYKPELRESFIKENDARKQQRNKVIDDGMQSGKSWEDISRETGVPLNQVQEYSLEKNPEYGVAEQKSAGNKVVGAIQGFGRNLGTSKGQDKADASLDASQDQILRLIRDPNIPEERRKKLMTLVAEQTYTAPQEAAANTKATEDQTNLKKMAVDAVMAAPRYVAEGTARAFGAGKETEGQKKADASLDASQTKILQILQDDKVPQERKDVLLANLNDENRQAVLGAAQNTSDIEAATNKRRFISSAYEVGLTPLAFSPTSLTVAGKSLQGLAKTGYAVGEGTVFGAIGAGQAEQLTPQNIVLGVVSGAAIPVAGAASRAGTRYMAQRGVNAESRVAQEVAQEFTQPITDTSRLLPAVGTVTDTIDNPRFIQTIEASPNMAAISRGVDPEDIVNLHAVEKEIATAQAGGIGADEGRALMQRRQEIIQRIQSPDNDTAKAIAVIDNKIAETTDKVEVKALTQQKEFIQREAIREAQSKQVAKELGTTPTGTKRSGLGARTEQEAIEKGFVDSIEDVPTYQTLNLRQQADEVVTLMNTDPEMAKKIAMGQAAAPQGINAEAVYEGVKRRAFRDKDTELIRQLATESKVVTEATKKGQAIASLAYKDPEDPVNALQEIVRARKTSKLGIPATVSKEEAERVTTLAQEVADAKVAMASTGDRLAYGRARVKYDNYLKELKIAANKKTVKEALMHPVDTALDVAGLTKSLRASLDNSALLRQGFKTLMTSPGVWLKNSIKSFQDIVRTVGGKEVLDEVGADIISRPNAINGLYKKMGIDVFGVTEEAFPTTIQEKIPGLGRAFKASDVAYTAFQQRTRAELADKYLEIAQKAGVDLTSKKELQSIGNLVNSLTSRGSLGRLEPSAKALNNVFFSPRLLKSNIDILTAHSFQRGVTPFVRKQAAKNLLKIIGGTSAILLLANEVRPGSVEWDPRSSDFGKIRIKDSRFDVSGGMAGLLTLSSRMASGSTKSSTSGEVTKYNSGDQNAPTYADTLLTFSENKLSPAAGVLVDLMKGEDFKGNAPTLKSIAGDLTIPLIVNNYNELKNQPNSANKLVAMLADSLGVSVNTYSPASDWNNKRYGNTQELQQFKQKVGKDKFQEANDKYNKQYNEWFNQVREDPKFWKLSQDDRKNYVIGKKDRLRNDVLKSYGYEYRKSKRSAPTDKLITELDKYK